jgi:KipI family sensor histidine kinase inhibitor
MEYSIHPFGDSALIVEAAEEISGSINAWIHALARVLESARPDGLLELIPAYNSLLAVYDPLIAEYRSMEAEVRKLIAGTVPATEAGAVIVDIPVCYEQPYAPDLEELAHRTGLSCGEVVAMHGEPLYLVYMLGFTPGFPYLGGMSDRIATPRRSSPRTRIPAGSVGIAGSQTGIYPIASPGGWNIIGRTPVVLFDSRKNPPALLAPGQRLRFRAIDAAEFERLSAGDGA